MLQALVSAAAGGRTLRVCGRGQARGHATPAAAHARSSTVGASPSSAHIPGMATKENEHEHDGSAAPAALTAGTFAGELFRLGVGLLAVDLLMVAATDADRTDARRLLLGCVEGGVHERAAFTEVLRHMTTPSSLLAAWLPLHGTGEEAIAVDAAATWLLAGLARDSASQRAMDSPARRADARDAAAQVVADGLRLLAPALGDLRVMDRWLATVEHWARERDGWPLDHLGEDFFSVD